MKCGCTVDKNCSERNQCIIFCPLHKAAEEMQLFVIWVYANHREQWPPTTQIKCRKLIAQAEGRHE